MEFLNLTRRIEIGSNCYCLDIAGKRIVIDCGMHPKMEGMEATPDLGLLPHDSVDAIILSHAHHDHVGSLPVLMRQQPRAPVLMTEPTRQLAGVMLHNSVSVMMKQREELGIASYPLFTHQEIEGQVKRWHGCPLHQRFSLDAERLGSNETDEISVEFFPSGHVLGAAGVMIRAQGRKIFYTGDVSFEDQNVSCAARFPNGPVDVLITETTRGDTETPPGFTRAGEKLRLAAAINAAFERGGCVVMPLFALGKTQELLAMFHELRTTDRIPVVPLYIGGLSTKLTELYDKLAHDWPRLVPEMQLLDTLAPFVVAGRSAGDTPIKEHRIYALSSGMMTEKTLSNGFARRILAEPQHSLFFVGYSDPESPAGRIKSAKPGDLVVVDPAFPPVPLRCHVEQFNFSSHGTRESILAYVKKLAPKKVVLVHGDAPAIRWFQKSIASEAPSSEVVLPEPGVWIVL